MASERHAFITGVGIVSPIGIGTEAFWDSLQSGRSAARTIQSFETDDFRTHLGCEIADSSLPGNLGAGISKLPRASRLAAIAARLALQDAELLPADIDAFVVGTTSADLPEIEVELLETGKCQNLQSIVRGSFSKRIANALNIRAPTQTVATACAAGNLAISRGLDLVRNGAADRVLVGGADAFSRLAFIGFSRLRGMAGDECRPFDKNRSGMLLGEGAAFLLLESRDSLAQGNRKPRATVLGYGLSCDAHHVAVPAPDGRGAARAMTLAFADSGISPQQIDYVCAHGTGTRQNDLAEAKACATVFGEHRPFVSSVKALTGHCLGAASAIEAAACVLSLQHQRLIPAWNIVDLDPLCDIEAPRPGSCSLDQDLSIVASNAFAFGGNNSCLVLAGAS